MSPDRRAKTVRMLGYICVVAGALDLVLAGVLALRDQTQAELPLLGAGIGALTLGIIMLALGKQGPKSGGERSSNAA
jgi:uncharacterized integral membrane protein